MMPPRWIRLTVALLSIAITSAIAGTFVTSSSSPTVFPDGSKSAAPGVSLRPGWTTDNVLSAAEMNSVHDALFDLRTGLRGLVFNVRHYGALGDGSTNDTIAVGAAYTALVAAGGGVLYFPTGRYKFNLTIAAPNVRVVGDGFSVPSFGTRGASQFEAQDVTVPIIKVGDGTSDVQGVTLEHFSAWGDGAGATNDLISIYGANNITIHSVLATSAGRDCLRLESSATKPVFFVNITDSHFKDARGASVRAIYGSQYVTSTHFANCSIKGYSTAGSYAIYSDATDLSLSNVWVEANAYPTGHVYLTGAGARLSCVNTTIDSASSADTLINLNFSRTAVSTYVSGTNLVIDGLARWSDASTTSCTATKHFGYDSARHVNPIVLGALYFNQSNAAAFDEGVALSPNITRTSASGSETVVVNNAAFRVGKRLSIPEVTLSYGTTIAVEAWQGNTFIIPVSNGVGFTISNPTNVSTGHRVVFRIKNTSGGAAGALTWGTAYKTAGAWTQPATANSRFIEFLYDGSVWQELWRSTADIAN